MTTERKWQIYEVFSAPGIRIVHYSLDGEKSVPAVKITVIKTQTGFHHSQLTWDGDVWRPCALDDELAGEQRRLHTELDAERAGGERANDYNWKLLMVVVCLSKIVWGLARMMTLILSVSEQHTERIFAAKLEKSCSELLGYLQDLGIRIDAFEEADIKIAASKNPDN